MPRAWPLLLLFALPACDTTLCAGDRLTAPSATPSWIVRSNDVPAFEPPMMPPGEEAFFDPPGTETYASFTLYEASGAIAAERWLDSLARWEAATGTATAAARFASRPAPGRVTLLLADGLRAYVTFSTGDGSVGPEIPAFSAPPQAAGQLQDAAWIDDRLAIASRRRTERAGGGDLLVLDPAERLVLRTLDLARLSTGPVEPGRIAHLEGDRYVVGLSFAEEDAGAVAVVDLATDAVNRLDVQGLTDCWEVATMAADPAAPTEGRVAALCRGDLKAPAETRQGVGFATITAGPDDPPAVTLARAGEPALLRNPPTGRLVGLAGGWVAALSDGAIDVGRDYVLLAVELDGEGLEALTQEPDSDLWGTPLGGGDFGGGELWWPSVTAGILRWSFDGGAFSPLPVADPPACVSTPPREIRYLPAP